MGCWTVIKSFHVKIILLDKQELIQEIQGKTTGQDLLDNIYKYLNLIETAYFGLRYQDNSNQTHWLDPTKRVSQQIKGISPITLYLGVKFYSADPCKLVEEITRYQFFLQVKLDILQGRLPVPQELSTELAALALQSELGDYDSSRHSPGYVSEFRFLANQTEDTEQRIEEAHSRLVGLVPSQAENRYLEKVKWLDMYGVDLHPVIGEDNIEYFLGLTPSGIIVLRNRNKVGNYFWPRISKIYFKGKYFMLRVRDKNNDESTYGFETPSRQACKHLWKCCVEHHAFFRLVQVSPTANSSGMFGLGSKFRYSGRTEKEVSQEITDVRRHPPNFTRVPSQRFSRRSRSEENEKRRSSTLERKEHGMSQSSLISRHLSNNNIYDQNMRGNSLPRNANLTLQSLPPGLLDGMDRSSSMLVEGGVDMSLQSLQYLESRGLFGSRSGQQSRRGSEVDTSHGPYAENGYTKKKSSRRGGSDDESEVSATSFASGRHHRKGNESGSESESSRSARKNHRGRRKRSGSYKLVETDEQWKEVQRQQGRKGGISEATVRKSGYVNSGAETESELVTTLRRNKRRQRSRSRSPSEARSKLPSELVKHFEFGLVEPGDPNNPQDIPYTNVETQKPIKVRYGSNGRRSRHSSGNSARRKINMDDSNRENEAPVQPYSYDPSHPSYDPNSGSWQSNTGHNSYTPQQAQVSSVETIQGSTASLNQSRQSEHNKYGYSEDGLPSTVPPPSISRPTPPIPHSIHSSLPPHLSSQPFHSPMMGYKAVNPTIGTMISNSPMGLPMSMHNGGHNHSSMVSSSSNNSSSSSPRQTNVHISEGFSGLPSLPATGLASLPAYNSVYNGGVALGHTPPVSRHNGVGPITTASSRQNGAIPNRQASHGPPPPPPVSRHNTNGVNSQSPLRQNGGPPIVGRMNVATPPVSRNHEQYSRNWPPNSQNQLDMHHVKKMMVPGVMVPGGSAKRPGHPYEPSGDEMSTEL